MPGIRREGLVSASEPCSSQVLREQLGSANSAPGTKASLLLVSVNKFYWDAATLVCLLLAVFMLQESGANDRDCRCCKA